MTVAGLVHTKGLGSALWHSRYSRIARSNSATLWNAPRLMRFVAISAKKRSTRLSQEADVGVKCRWNRGWAASHSFTSGVLWVP